MQRFSYAAVSAVAAITMGASTHASAQLTLAVDINGFEYGFFDSSGAAGFGGENHTGTMRWAFSSEEPRIVDARIGTEGPFGELETIPVGALLTALDGTVELNNGQVQGGNFFIQLDSGDRYSAELSAGALTQLSTGSFFLDGLTFAGMFNDDTFGDIDVSAFGDNLPGLAFVLRMDPTRSGDGSGTADLEVFVMVPLPPAAVAGMATLAGVMGFAAIRRRRMG